MFSAGRVLIKPKGDYSPLKTYEMLDLVSYNGSSYIAKKTTTGNLPTDTEYWQLSASGAQGQNVTSNFAEVEGSDIASSPHAIDDVFVNKDGKLLKATQAISIGDTIVIDTNCEPTTVEDLISYLSTQVSTLDSSNKKLNGITEIAVQTDLHTLGLGEFYKDKTSFYVTNGPEEVDEVASAIFRLTVESALNDSSTTRLLTLKTPGGKVYTQNYDGSSWEDWEQVASESEVGLKQNITDNTLQTTSKTVPGAINELFLKSQTLTNNVNVLAENGAINILPNKAISDTINGITFTVNSDGSVSAGGTATANAYLILSDIVLNAGSYKLSGCPSGGGSNTYCIFVENSASAYDNGNGATFVLSNSGTIRTCIKVSSGQTISDLVFKPMITDADYSGDYVPYAMTNRKMTPYVQAISNPNLLDNPWFTVNQRGQSSYSGVGYTVDRWIIPNTKTIVTVNSDNSISLSATENNSNSFIQSKFDVELFNKLKGRTITFSIMLDDGTILSKTGVFPSSYSTSSSICTMGDTQLNISGIYVQTSGQTWVQVGHVYSGTAKTIKAVKLELGSVSTLAMDTAPNYATELLKCQRYFVRIKNPSTGYKALINIGQGRTVSSDTIAFSVPLPVEMRTVPTVTHSQDAMSYSSTTSATGTGENATDINTFAIAGHIRSLYLSGPNITVGETYMVFLNPQSYLDFSADL